MQTQMIQKAKIRCPWVGDDPQMQKYHDTIWGLPKYNDQDIFEAIVLDTHQAGLSWKCILHKRDNFAKAFYNFDPKKISKMTARDVARLMKDVGIIRNRLKIQSTINNAKRFLEIQKEFGTFSKYIWQFTHNRVIFGRPRRSEDYRSHSKESDAMSADLKARGFKFVGTTICYAFMQGIGMINDHSTTCFRLKQKHVK